MMIKRISAIALATFLSINVIGSSSALSPGAARVKYSNCKELNRVYPGGVSKSFSVKNQGGKTKLKPTVNSKVYLDNAGKDRDKDGIACEK